MLPNNGGDNLAVNANGNFTFATPRASGSSYNVSVLSHAGPTAQTCSVSSGAGTVGSGNVTTVAINCAANTFTVGGTVTGLSGAGLVLPTTAGDNVTIAQNGSFAFPTPIASGGTYSVTRLTNPVNPWQTCTVSNGAGTVGAASVTSIAVSCTANTYAVSGTVTGLANGDAIVLRNNGADALTVNANGSFAFATPIASGATYSVTTTSPSSPVAQTCSVTSGSGSITSASVTNVAITCAANTYRVGGSVTGLVGSGLVLHSSSGDNLAITQNGAFVFPTSVASGASYSATVLTNPSVPSQSCVVASGAGVVASADVTSITVTCTTSTFSVGGSVSGLAAGDSLVLANNGGDNLTVNANGSFTFATPRASGASYSVSVLSQSGATAQTCSVGSGAGVVGGGNITNVAVTCTANTYRVGGTVSGLVGSGLVLSDSAGDNIAITQNGAFVFPTRIASHAAFSATVLTNPGSPAQSCVVSNGSGVVANTDVATIAVTCTTSSFSIGGSVSGLAAGDSLVLANNGGDDLAVSANGNFAFATPRASGASYNVTVLSHAGPTAQTCTVSSGAGVVGSGNVATVAINCEANSFTVGGTVTGLSGAGLVLQNNAGESVTVAQNGSFSFATPIASGGAYSVTKFSDPVNPWQTCTLANAAGTVAAANVTSVTVSCSANTYAVGGTVTGLASGDSIVLTNNAGDPLTVSANGAFAFATPIASGATFAVSATSPSSPIAQTCTVWSGSGSITSGAVSSVRVNCSRDSFTLGGTVTGLAGSGVVLQNTSSGDNVTVAQNGAVTFATPLMSGETYSVTKLSDPVEPWQTCTVANGSGTVSDSNVTSLSVSCATNSYTVSGSVSGLAPGNAIVLTNNGGDDVTVNANGSFAFATPIASGGAYSVVATNPSSPVAQVCTVTSGSGTITSGNVTNVSVSCATNTFAVGGTVTGLVGSGLVLQNSGGDNLTITQNGAFAFPTRIASNASYSATVLTNPGSPWQTCVPSSGAGSVAARTSRASRSPARRTTSPSAVR